MHTYSLCTIVAACVLSLASVAHAQNSSPFLLGPMGLNTIPNARMAEKGTIAINTSTLDPYIHTSLGFQLADPLFINFRQTAEISNLNEDADRLYPGVDFKLRLLKESRSRPELSLGVQSALGHKRMAGEYLAASKRYNDFDFTAGIGWGRYGSAGHFNNPLKALWNSHFGQTRSVDGEKPNKLHNWFTGEKVGLFGGLEYTTPIKGLSLKFDYGADRYSAEQTALGFEKPSPWSAGISYTPFDWLDLSIGAQGTEKLMGRLSLSPNIKNWRDHMNGRTQPAYMRPYRTGLALPSQMEIAAARSNVLLYKTSTNTQRADTRIVLDPDLPTPYQIGLAATHMSNHAGPHIEELVITPTFMGLQGRSVTLLRHDLEQAHAHNNGSANEIWQHAEFTDTNHHKPWKKSQRPAENPNRYGYFHFVLDNQLSLSEEDNGSLYRSTFVAGARQLDFFGIVDTGFSFRGKITDNLDKITRIRPRSANPVRSDVNVFAQRGFALDTLYQSLTHSFTPDLHGALTYGYLEEMFAGGGGEILYRPFGKRYGIGAESWTVYKRSPYTTLNTGLTGEPIHTAHINAWYDIPKHDITLRGSVGRYLGDDFGGTLSLRKSFKNGAVLEGYTTITDDSDDDLFGGTTHAYQGIQLSLPLGGFEFAPKRSTVNFTLEPFGRDSGQRLKTPVPLYEATESLSMPHMVQNWDRITEKKRPPLKGDEER